MNLHRHSHTFLTLEQMATSRVMPYRRTYEFAGDFIDEQHEKLGTARRNSNGFIDIGLYGLLSPTDALKLYELTYFCGGDVLELGTGYGLSAFIEAQASHAAGLDNEIVTIEILPDRVAIAQKRLLSKHGCERVRFICGNYIHVLKEMERSFKFVFVDHSHDFDNVYWLCKNYLAKVMEPGAFVLFHDFNDPRNPDKEHKDYGVYQGVQGGLDASRFEFWGIYGCAGLFRLK